MLVSGDWCVSLKKLGPVYEVQKFFCLETVRRGFYCCWD